MSDEERVLMHGERVVLDHGDVAAEIEALTSAAGMVDMRGRRRVWVRGGDRVPFLQRMLTQDVTQIGLDASAPAAMCTAQGRIIGLGLLVGFPDSLLFDIPAVMGDELLGSLERYTLFDEVEFVECSDEIAHLHLGGPGANAALQAIAEGEDGLPEGAYGAAPMSCEGVEFTAVRHSRAGVPGIDLFIASDSMTLLAEALEGAGVRWVGHAALEAVRVESGVPVAGAELTDDVIPVEAGLDHFVSYTKGCYVGQEVIAKIKYLGEPPRTLVGIQAAEGSLAPGDELFSGSRRVGRVTSVGAALSLGFVRTRSASAGTRLTVGGVDGAEVTLESLPRVATHAHHQSGIGEVLSE